MKNERTGQVVSHHVRRFRGDQLLQLEDGHGEDSCCHNHEERPSHD